MVANIINFNYGMHEYKYYESEVYLRYITNNVIVKTESLSLFDKKQNNIFVKTLRNKLSSSS